MKNLFFVFIFIYASAMGFSQEYRIGDIGPAGGYIFFDKGHFSNGWRYLEVAPRETEVELVWARGQGRFVNIGTSTEIGTGKNNTRLLVSFFRQDNVFGTAAQYCYMLEFGGFNDWFLPSRDELALLFTNLHSRGIGGFRNNVYWSSSERNTFMSMSAWGISSTTGHQDYFMKEQSGILVRAIRAF